MWKHSDEERFKVIFLDTKNIYILIFLNLLLNHAVSFQNI
jgi:hypothetical protein